MSLKGISSLCIQLFYLKFALCRCHSIGCQGRSRHLALCYTESYKYVWSQFFVWDVFFNEKCGFFVSKCKFPWKCSGFSLEKNKNSMKTQKLYAGTKTFPDEFHLQALSTWALVNIGRNACIVVSFVIHVTTIKLQY